MIIIISNFDEKVSDLVKKYLLKTNQRSHEVKFVFNAKALNLELTCAEAGIDNGSYIYVVVVPSVKGAGGAGPWLDKEINKN